MWLAEFASLIPSEFEARVVPGVRARCHGRCFPRTLSLVPALAQPDLQALTRSPHFWRHQMAKRREKTYPGAKAGVGRSLISIIFVPRDGAFPATHTAPASHEIDEMVNSEASLS